MINRFIFSICILHLFTSVSLSQTITINEFGTSAITPNDSDYIAYFGRIIHNNGYWVIYSAADTSMNLNNQTVKSFNRMAYRKYIINTSSLSFDYDSLCGIFPSFENLNVGDYAIDYDGSNIFNIIGDGGMNGCRISKFDNSFQFIDSVYINALDSNAGCNDQLLNIVNNKLIALRIYSSNNTNYPHILEYNKNLNLLRDTVIKSTSFIPTGGVLMFHNNKYHVITANEFLGSDLYVYQFDTNWAYLSSTLLLDSAQWSQGYAKYGSYHLIAYHTPDDHTKGNVEVGIFDANWNLLTTKKVTNFSTTSVSSELKCAQRPSLLLKNDTLLVSYDVTYNNSYPYVAKEQVYISIYVLDTIVVSNITENFAANLVVSPNPTSNFLNVNLKNQLKSAVDRVCIYDLLGNTVYFNNSFIETIDLSTLTNGIYFFSIETSIGVCTKKIVLDK